MPDLPINREALRGRVKNLDVYKAAVNMHTQYRPDQGNLERFSKAWEEEILTLIDSYAASLVEENKKHSPDWHYGHTEACFKNFSRYCTCGADAKNKQRATLLGRLSEEGK